MIHKKTRGLPRQSGGYYDYFRTNHLDCSCSQFGPLIPHMSRSVDARKRKQASAAVWPRKACQSAKYCNYLWESQRKQQHSGGNQRQDAFLARSPRCQTQVSFLRHRAKLGARADGAQDKQPSDCLARSWFDRAQDHGFDTVDLNALQERRVAWSSQQDAFNQCFCMSPQGFTCSG